MGEPHLADVCWAQWPELNQQLQHGRATSPNLPARIANRPSMFVVQSA